MGLSRHEPDFLSQPPALECNTSQDLHRVTYSEGKDVTDVSSWYTAGSTMPVAYTNGLAILWRLVFFTERLTTFRKILAFGKTLCRSDLISITTRKRKTQIKIKYWGWGDGFVGRELDKQAWGPEFRTLSVCPVLCLWPQCWEVETGGSRGSGRSWPASLVTKTVGSVIDPHLKN